MRTTGIITGLAIAALTVAGGGLALAATGSAAAAPPTVVPRATTAPRVTTAPRAGTTVLPTAPLSDQEKADLLRMADEERMAKDLYTAIAAKYPDATTFTRIASSEQRHEQRVLALLDRYQLPHPSATTGTYDNRTVQKLHDDWLARAQTSVGAAYRVGVDLEQADIADLRTTIDTSDNADLDQLYGHLLTASQHHEAAFTAGPDGTPALGPDGQGARNGQGPIAISGRQARSSSPGQHQAEGRASAGTG